MQSPVKDARRSDLHLPEFERPSIDLKDMKMPKIDLSDIDMPKVDVGKAVLSAATAVGLAKPRRARWPYLVVAGVAVAVAGWALMNAEAIRTRLSRAATWANEQLGAMRSGDEFDEPVAFTAARRHRSRIRPTRASRRRRRPTTRRRQATIRKASAQPSPRPRTADRPRPAPADRSAALAVRPEG